MALLALACRQEQAPSPPSVGAGGSGLVPVPTTRTAVAPPGPVAADSRDDPAAPRALPKSADLAGWTKIRPVRVMDASELRGSSSLPEDQRPAGHGAGVGLFTVLHARRVALCAYEHGTSRTRAAVLLAEMPTPHDAFAALALLTAEPASWDGAGSCFIAVDGLGFLGCKADVCVEIRVSNVDGDEGRNATLALLKRILFALPAAEAPLLVRALPPDQLAGTKTWLVRSTATFQLASVGERVATAQMSKGVQRSLETLRGLNGPEMDARLGLTGDLWLSVAAVPVGKDEPPNLIWLVGYADATAAGDAYQRYRKALTSPASDLDANTIIQPPQGPILIGSWTADQESLQNLLPQLRDRLPG